MREDCRQSTVCEDVVLSSRRCSRLGGRRCLVRREGTTTAFINIIAVVIIAVVIAFVIIIEADSGNRLLLITRFSRSGLAITVVVSYCCYFHCPASLAAGSGAVGCLLC